MAESEEDRPLGLEALLDEPLDRAEDGQQRILAVGRAPPPDPAVLVDVAREGWVRPAVDRRGRDGHRILGFGKRGVRRGMQACSRLMGVSTPPTLLAGGEI
jgi:hypothetical protein